MYIHISICVTCLLRICDMTLLHMCHMSSMWHDSFIWEKDMKESCHIYKETCDTYEEVISHKWMSHMYPSYMWHDSFMCLSPRDWCVCVCVCMFECVCVCVWERESEYLCVCERERERKREKERARERKQMREREGPLSSCEMSIQVYVIHWESSGTTLTVSATCHTLSCAPTITRLRTLSWKLREAFSYSGMDAIRSQSS